MQTVHNADNQVSGYRSIFKATSLFGGVQVYQILIQIVKSKILALLLGPTGIGIQGLFQSALDLVKQGTSMGVAQSAVRDVAEAYGSGDKNRINRTVSILRKIVWGTGGLGLVLMISFSPLFSNSSFGNSLYITSFCILAIIPLLDQISAGQKVILQGTHRIKELAKASAIGATLGLFFSVPFYYFYREKGIVPALIVFSIVSLIVSAYYSNKYKIQSVPVTLDGIKSIGRSILGMGLAMSTSGFLSMGVAYVLRSYVSKYGGILEVGLYQAGLLIVNTYVGMVFNAISTDYYPRLAAINRDNNRCKEVINQQGEISVLILAPLLALCIIAMPIGIKLLYTNEFLPADNFIKWSCLGMMFRLSSWLLSYLFIAKGNAKLFITCEVLGNLISLLLGIIGYQLAGLTGLGLSFCIGYILYSLIVFVFAKKNYAFSFSSKFLIEFIVEFVLLLLTLLSILYLGEGLNYIISSICGAIIIAYSAWKLNKALNIKGVVDKLRKR